MRKFTILFAGLILSLLISCQNRNFDNPNDQEPISTSPYAVSYDEAVDEVYSLIDDLGMNTKSGGRKIIANHHVVTLDNPYTPGTKSGEGDSSEEAPFFHIINFESDEGFAIVSGDNRLAPVLALTESGNFTPGEEIDNPGFQLAYDQIVDYVAYGSGMIPFDPNVDTIFKPQPPPSPDPKPIDLGDDVTGPWVITKRTGSIIPTKWDQYVPWNAKCPLVGGGALDYYREPKRKQVGCGAVAVGQVMYYHEYPAYNYYDHKFDWNRMRNILNSGDARYGDPIGGEMVAQLLACIGQTGNLSMDYGVDVSSCKVKDIPRTFKNMGYASGGTLYSYMFTRIEESLSRGRPVIVSGYRDKTWLVIPNKGHAWVIDETVRRKLTTRHGDGSISSGYFNLVHCNWGWAGDSDGYFADGIFHIKDDVNNIDYNYRYKQEIIMDIYR